jgi:hypothetical protein
VIRGDRDEAEALGRDPASIEMTLGIDRLVIALRAKSNGRRPPRARRFNAEVLVPTPEL